MQKNITDPQMQELFRITRETRELLFSYSPLPELSAVQFHMLFMIFQKDKIAQCTEEKDKKKQPGKRAGRTRQPDSAEDRVPGLKITDLARMMHNSTPTVSERASELENLGYIERSRSSQDRRIVYLSLTEEGLRLMSRAAQLYDNLGSRIAERIGREEFDHFLATLSELKTALAAEEADFAASLAAEKAAQSAAKAVSAASQKAASRAAKAAGAARKKQE